MKSQTPLPVSIGPDDLAVIGRLCVSLAPEGLNECIDGALRLLLNAVGCDALELYLSDPDGRELVLYTYAGSAPERTRCAIGQGIAGLAALEMRTISSPDVEGDRQLATHQLVRSRACVAVPLGTPPRLTGVLLATWRKPQDVKNAEGMLTLAALPLRNAIDARTGLLRERVRSAFRNARNARPDIDACARELLQEMQEVGHFHAATFYLNDGQREWSVHHIALPAGLRKGSTLTESGELGECPYLTDGRPIVLYGANRHWPARCRVAGDGTTCRVCLPLHVPGLDGALRLSYASDPPSPPTRYLSALEVMTHEAAVHLRGMPQARPSPRASMPAEMEPARQAPPVKPPSGHYRLDFHCFGRLHVERDGQAIDVRNFRRHSSLTLLKLLLIAAGNPVPKETICELLWPGAEASAGANRLHGVVHALRQALEPRAKERQWLYICGRGDYYYFNLGSPHSVDFIDFKQLATRGRALEQSGHAADALRALEEAARLYRGDLFEDDPNPEWFSGERESLREMQVDVLTTLARLHARQPDQERAVAALRSALKLRPGREDIHQSLMRWLASWGRRKEALLQFDECAQVLREQLDADPLPETVRMRDEIVSSLRPAS